MNPNLPLFIGFRYTRGKRRNGFVSFISLLSFIAMTFGVMALIVVLSVMNGFDREIKTRVLNIVPHAALSQPGGVADWQQLGLQALQQDQVSAFSPYVEGYGMLSAQGMSQGVLVQGVDPTLEQQVTGVHQHMQAGDMMALQPGEFGIVLGHLLARSLRVIVGDSVILSLPQLNVTPVGVFPRYKRFYVQGVFQVGAQVDSGLALVHYQDAQKLYRTGSKVHGIRLRTKDPFRLDKNSLLNDAMPKDINVTTWGDSMSSLFQAIKMEKMVVGTLLAAIIAVAAFNIIASLVLMVSDKRGDMAVLRTLGATSSTVSKIFIVQGSVVGISGVLTGTALGCLLAVSVGGILQWLEQQMGFYVFDPSVYFISQLPSQLLWQDVLVVSSLGMALSVLATLYPAYRAGQILPAEALRYDH